MRQKVLLIAVLAVLPLAAALAQNGPAGGLTPEEIVKARQAAYGLSAGTFGEMKMALDAGAEIRPLAFGARNLQRWARTLPSLFPEGSNVAPTQAKAEVWSDRAGFELRAQAYAEAAGQLAEAAQGGDRAAFAAQWDAVRATCSGCHDQYRNTPQR